MNSSADDRIRDTNPQASKDVRRRLVAESLRVGNPANNARDLPAQADPLRECQIELAVGDIRTYEHNPRRADNARFLEIKESIRASGVRNPITVTRRPDETHFIVEAGGNTRLRAVQQLLQETGEAHFQKLGVLFRPWRSESHVLIAHLIENEQRGDMTFWDKANGIAALKAQLETEQGRALSARQLETELNVVGIAVSRTTLGYYHFATTRLSLLGKVITGLSGNDVARVQPRLNLLKTYAQMRASIDEVVLYEQLLEPVFRRHAETYRQRQTFRVDALCADCEAALARYLREPLEDCRKALAALACPVATTISGPDDAQNAQSAVPKDEGETIADGEIADAFTDNPLVTASTAMTPLTDKSLVAEAATDTRGNSEPPIDGGRLPDAAHGDDRLRLTAEIERFAHLSGISDCLCREGNAPLGYRMIALSAPDRESVPILKRRAWSLLRLLCGRFDQGPPLECLHQENTEDAGAADQGVLTAVDLSFLLWLFDAADGAASSFRQIMSLLRKYRDCSPDDLVGVGARGAEPESC